MITLPSNMRSGWKQYRRRVGKKSNQTVGKTKGEHCQTGGAKKFCLSAAKGYKHPDYAFWHQYAKNQKGNKS